MKKIIKIVFISVCLSGVLIADKNITISSNDTTCKDNISTPDANISSFEQEFGDLNKTKTFDPFEKYNRVVTTFNDKFYTNILDPVARGYSKVIPENGRIAIGNFINNLYFPVRFANNLLQLKINKAAKETGRFIVNSTIGIGGFFDIANRDFKWEESDEDFGQTLGFYGIPTGPHIVWPFLGPSNLRDTIGLVTDSYVNALSSVKKYSIKYKIPKNLIQEARIYAYEKINKTSLHPKEYEEMKKDAIDFYSFIRDAYTQYRKEQIKE